ncbi:hypothetical protein [Limnoglobus roseus]|uniref:Plasmid related protein n=1 Tax=Limnoglobus roseus TaxID=2598579 RepID=A0A5C1AEX0_9BACT|nr:hypothetical protein [Limnoglobus roseus]QEL17861.1 hypothetical protein PX52LOC_04872 [Limnoglobus roseus]
MIAVNTPKFQMGKVVATPGALAALEEAGHSPWVYLSLHVEANWGTVDADDKAANDNALRDGSRILSAYRLNTGEKIWIITDAEDDHGHRQSTTILLPDEY